MTSRCRSGFKTSMIHNSSEVRISKQNRLATSSSSHDSEQRGGWPPALLHFFYFNWRNPLLQELPLWFLLGQGQSFLIRGPSLSCPAEPAVHICSGGMRQVIIYQFAIFQHRIDMRQAGLWTIAHGN